MLDDPHSTGRLRHAGVALLLLLPALGLAILSGRALYRERLAWRGELELRAREHAQGIAERLVRLVEAAQATQPQFDGQNAPSTPIEGVTHARLVLDHSGGLAWPKSAPWPPRPQPLDTQLPENLATLRAQAEAAEEQHDPGTAATLWGRFIDTVQTLPADTQPVRLAINARLRHAIALRQTGQESAAIRALEETVRESFRIENPVERTTEAGVPIAVLALFELLTKTDDATALPASTQDVADWARVLVVEPYSPLLETLAQRLLPALEAGGQSANSNFNSIVETWQRHSLARRFHKALKSKHGESQPDPSQHHIVEIDHMTWLAVRRETESPEMFPTYLLHPWSRLFDTAQQALRDLDPRDQHGLALRVSTSKWQLERETSLGIRESGLAPFIVNLAPEFQLSVWIAPTDPASLLAAQARRERTLGSLVLAGLVVSLFASGLAWRLLAHQDRLHRHKSHLLAAVSHELRAPLASIRLLANNLECGRVPDPDRQADALRLIGRECRRLGALVDNVLDLSRMERGRQSFSMESTDVSLLLRDALESMEPAAREKGLALRLEIAPAVLSADICMDGRAIQQSLVNLLENAIKHGPAGTDVVLQATLDPVTGSPRFLDLTVTDQGPGIPPEDRERVFKPFFRLGSELRRQTPGTGIGLSIVRHVVRAHKGRVWIEAPTAGGTRVVLQLPLLRESLSPGKPSSPETSRA